MTTEDGSGIRVPERSSYTDIVITPPQAAESEAPDFHHATNGGEAALARMWPRPGDSLKHAYRCGPKPVMVNAAE